MRKQTWFAVIVCVVLMVPSFFVGALVKIIYHAVVLYFTGPDPDPFHIHAWFGVDAVRTSWRWMYRDVMPNVLQGLFAGVVAFELTGYICRGARLIKAGLITGLIYTAFVAVSAIVFPPANSACPRCGHVGLSAHRHLVRSPTRDGLHIRGWRKTRIVSRAVFHCSFSYRAAEQVRRCF
jgi:hypothetical protein